jgi:subtilisin-like proprotein convertase family protein
MALNTFSNTTAIPIGPDVSASTPYPSPIVVSGVPGNVTKVVVALVNFTHIFNSDVEIVLQAPDSAKYTMLMGDCGSNGQTLTPVTLTFDQSAANNLPDVAGQPFVTGTYKPTNYVSGNPDVDLPSPAPPANPLPYAANLDVFNGTAANGTWKLFVFDDGAGDGGNIANGWTLTLTTTDVAINGSASGLIKKATAKVPTASASSSGSNSGLVSLTKTLGAAANVNLSVLGALDWWKYSVTNGDYETTAKVVTDRLIGGAYTIVPGFNAEGLGDSTFQWSNGSPIPTGSNNGMALRCQATVGSGWEITVKANQAEQKFTLFCATFSCTSRLTVSISDGSSAQLTDTIVCANNVLSTARYDIEFLSQTAGATITLRYEILSIPGATAPYLAVAASALNFSAGGVSATARGNFAKATARAPAATTSVGTTGTGSLNKVTARPVTGVAVGTTVGSGTGLGALVKASCSVVTAVAEGTSSEKPAGHTMHGGWLEDTPPKKKVKANPKTPVIDAIPEVSAEELSAAQQRAEALRIEQAREVEQASLNARNLQAWQGKPPEEPKVYIKKPLRTSMFRRLPKR